MKLTLMLPALAGFLVLTGCEGGGPQTPDLLSLDPVATDQEVTVDSQLVGAWESSDSGDRRVSSSGMATRATTSRTSEVVRRSDSTAGCSWWGMRGCWN